MKHTFDDIRHSNIDNKSHPLAEISWDSPVPHMHGKRRYNGWLHCTIVGLDYYREAEKVEYTAESSQKVGTN